MLLFFFSFSRSVADEPAAHGAHHQRRGIHPLGKVGFFFFIFFIFFIFFFGLKILVRVSFVLPPLFVCLGFFSFFLVPSLPPRNQRNYTNENNDHHHEDGGAV